MELRALQGRETSRWGQPRHTEPEPLGRARLTYHRQVQGCPLPAYHISDVAGVEATVRLLSLPYPQHSEVFRQRRALFRGERMSLLIPGCAVPSGTRQTSSMGEPARLDLHWSSGCGTGSEKQRAHGGTPGSASPALLRATELADSENTEPLGEQKGLSLLIYTLGQFGGR